MDHVFYLVAARRELQLQIWEFVSYSVSYDAKRKVGKLYTGKVMEYVLCWKGQLHELLQKGDVVLGIVQCSYN